MLIRAYNLWAVIVHGIVTGNAKKGGPSSLSADICCGKKLGGKRDRPDTRREELYEGGGQEALQDEQRCTLVGAAVLWFSTLCC